MTNEQLKAAIAYLPAILLLIAQGVILLMAGFLAVAGVVMAINLMLELVHKALNRITGASDDVRISAQASRCLSVVLVARSSSCSSATVARNLSISACISGVSA
jgi:hypothetical protein